MIYTIINGPGKWDFEETRISEVSFNFKVDKLEISKNLLQSLFL
jgi:hypothetical protein